MRLRLALTVVALVTVVVAGVLVARAGARAEVREIALVGREMAFYEAGRPEGNPTLRVRAGERVRLVLRNDTPGIVHDLAIDALRVAIGPLETGGMAAVEFRAPERPGRYEYYCRPHALMMRGVLEVVAL